MTGGAVAVEHEGTILQICGHNGRGSDGDHGGEESRGDLTEEDVRERGRMDRSEDCDCSWEREIDRVRTPIPVSAAITPVRAMTITVAKKVAAVS